MSSVAIYTKSGTKSANKITLDKSIFDISDINQTLIHQAYSAYLANGRISLAKTKTRGQVSGSNKKPWKQKGTGRARVGSKRTPLWRGGGIVFGPTGNENYHLKLNVNTKRSALRHSLSALNQEKAIKVIDQLEIKEAKTKALVKLLNEVGLEGNILIVTDNPSPEIRLAAQNLDNVSVIQTQYMNVARIIDADHLLITKESLTTINNWLGDKPTTGDTK